MTEPTGARWLRWAVAMVWLATGVCVLHPAYREVGAGYLDRLGLPHWLMYATCAGEVALAVRLLAAPAGAALTWLQVAAVAAFTAILAGLDPTLLAHPFGVLSKNLPLVAAVVAAWLVDRDGWTPRAEWILRGGVASIWITEGVFPKIAFQQAWEVEVVARSGLVPIDPAAFLVALGVAQALSGIALLVLPRRALWWVLAGQLLALVVLPALVSAQNPLLWVHPFGPLTKNLPIIAATLVLYLRWVPFVSARWSYLTVVSWAIPPERAAGLMPPGVDLDTRDGRAFVSLVTLDFTGTRGMGFPVVGARGFPDVNLRVYARTRDGARRGVVFVRELVPRRFAAWAARTVFREPFACAPVRSDVRVDGGDPIAVDIERAFDRGGRTHTVRMRAVGPARSVLDDDDAAFFTERYWGFGHDRRGAAMVYAVEHPPWDALRVDDWTVDVDWAAAYGDDWAFLADLEPCAVHCAVGSPAGVYFPV